MRDEKAQGNRNSTGIAIPESLRLFFDTYTKQTILSMGSFRDGGFVSGGVKSLIGKTHPR